MRISYWATFLLSTFWFIGPVSVATAAPATLVLDSGWKLQSARDAHSMGAEISKNGFADSSWMTSRVPSTVVGARVDNGVDPNPFFGTNFRKIPGTSYPVGTDFTKLPTPSDSPFQGAWWFRKEFTTSAIVAGERVWLKLDGLNFRANVWLNGRRIADAKDVVGPFRRFEFDITSNLEPEGDQTLAIEVFPSSPENLALTWIDWAPTPADKNMGLLNEVSILRTNSLRILNPWIGTELETPSLENAELSVFTTIENGSDESKRAEVRGQIEGVTFSRILLLAPHARTEVRFDPSTDPSLKVHHPRVWWPRPIGEPEMYHAELEVREAGIVSDSRTLPFGIRRFTSELDAQDHRLFRVNGRRILIRGGGWAPDLFLRWDEARTEAQLRYLQHLNLNTVRLEGKLENDAFFEMTDRMGILVMAGWSCCDRWQDGAHWGEEDLRIARESMRDQARRLRNHPSLLVWLYGSDEPPPPNLEKMYLDVLQEEHWPVPSLSSASDESTPLTGKSGVKMTGPYEWVPPSYWLQDTGHGGAFGFNTETSPGPAVPPIETLREFLPPDHLWPIDETWNFHAGGDVFKTIDVFRKALDERYGPSASVEEFAMKSQVAALESHRAMFEAFGKNKYRESTGVVQWMLGNPWPSLIWHLFDHSLRPGGSYFGARTANEPLHIQYSYDDRTVVVVNDRSVSEAELHAEATLLDFSLREVFHSRKTLAVGSDSVEKALKLPQFEGLPDGPFFLSLRLENEHGKELSRNFYWLSARPDVSDFGHSEWWGTPVKQYADFRRLNDLPPVTLLVQAEELPALPQAPSGERRIHVRISNPNPQLAFSNRLQLTATDSGDELLPVLWDDNYFALLPWETRDLESRLPPALPGRPVHSTPLSVKWSGWNTVAGGTEIR